ncbi:MAG: hypothetical protein HOP11_05680 [Saprospiraceae bacterium]|nr:hypothetical protein [Saprospiraceae bacterium]
MYTEEIHNLLNQKFEEEGFRDCFLIDIEQKGRNIWIFLDSDKSITYDICKAISRHLEAVFDEKSWFGDDYILEVSSAGISRSLRYPRQYIKNLGRDIKIQCHDNTSYEGKICKADQEIVGIEFEEISKEGKKKIKSLKNLDIKYSNIKEAKIIARI